MSLRERPRPHQKLGNILLALVVAFVAEDKTLFPIIQHDGVGMTVYHLPKSRSELLKTTCSFLTFIRITIINFKH